MSITLVNFKNNIIGFAVFFSELAEISNGFIGILVCTMRMPVDKYVKTSVDSSFDNVLDKRFAASVVRNAVILNAIIGADEPETVPVFADHSSVPVWAQGSLYALSNAGIFTGTGSGNLSPNASLSRAQTAQILLTVKKYIEG